MTGGIMSAVHRLTVERNGQRLFFVLRQFGDAAAGYGGRAEREAGILRAVSTAGLPAPELVACSPDGADTDGHPSVLMTRLRGHLHLAPEDPRGRLTGVVDWGMAVTGPPELDVGHCRYQRIHNCGPW